MVFAVGLNQSQDIASVTTASSLPTTKDITPLLELKAADINDCKGADCLNINDAFFLLQSKIKTMLIEKQEQSETIYNQEVIKQKQLAKMIEQEDKIDEQSALIAKLQSAHPNQPDTDIAKLEAELADLKAEQDKKNSIIANLKDQVATQTKTVEKLQSECDHSADNEKMEAELAKLKAEQDKKNSIIANLKDQVATQTKTIEKLQSECDHSADNAKMEAKLAKLKAEQVNANAIIANLKNRVANQTETIANLKPYCDHLEAEIADLKAEQENKETIIANLKDQVAKQTETIANLKPQCDHLEAEIADLEAEQEKKDVITANLKDQLKKEKAINADLQAERDRQNALDITNEYPDAQLLFDVRRSPSPAPDPATDPEDLENTFTYDKAITNIGNRMNIVTGIFTAPKTGKYYLAWTGPNGESIPRAFVSVLTVNGDDEREGWKNPSVKTQMLTNLNKGDKVVLSALFKVVYTPKQYEKFIGYYLGPI